VGATVEFDTKFRSNEKDALRAVDVTSVGERQRREVKRLTKEGKTSQSSGIRSFVGVTAMSEVLHPHGNRNMTQWIQRAPPNNNNRIIWRSIFSLIQV
jgi:hypothetical protein